MSQNARETYCFLFQTTVCERIIEAVTGQQDLGQERKVISLSQDSFYRELTPRESQKAAKGLFNFDHPGTAYNYKLLAFIGNFYIANQLIIEPIIVLM